MNTDAANSALAYLEAGANPTSATSSIANGLPPPPTATYRDRIGWRGICTLVVNNKTISRKGNRHRNHAAADPVAGFRSSSREYRRRDRATLLPPAPLLGIFRRTRRLDNRLKHCHDGFWLRETSTKEHRLRSGSGQALLIGECFQDELARLPDIDKTLLVRRSLKMATLQFRALRVATMLLPFDHDAHSTQSTRPSPFWCRARRWESWRDFHAATPILTQTPPSPANDRSAPPIAGPPNSSGSFLQTGTAPPPTAPPAGHTPR